MTKIIGNGARPTVPAMDPKAHWQWTPPPCQGFQAGQWWRQSLTAGSVREGST